MNNTCFRTSFGFGLASGVITTLGLMIGLFSSTYSKGVVLGGIITIAVADACSDAVGIHFSEESEGVHTNKEIWFSTFITFLSKFIVSISFIPMIFLFSLNVGIIINIIWGFLLLSVFSYIIAVKQKNNPFRAILEHVLIMLIVICITYYLGKLIDRFIII
jgi:VIT1/CCC1 family predicted Fe2+/Mn2+ transporter